jgi:putative ABC transport system permease protein
MEFDGKTVNSFVQDLRFALRMLRKNPGFTTVAVLVLAIGIGASTAIFSVVDAVLLRLPYPNADRLVAIQDSYADFGNVTISYPQYLYWKNQRQIFDHVITLSQGSAALTGLGEAERIKTLNISAETLATLGLTPLQGRDFLPEEDARTANPVAMLTEPFWRGRFDSSSSVVGEKLTLNDLVYTVVGVLPASFRSGRDPDVVMPLRMDTQTSPAHLNSLEVIGQLRPGISVTQARAAVAAAFPAYKKEDTDLTGVALTPYRDFIATGSRPLLLVLLGAVLAVLLIACTNTANLLLARAAAREKEIAIRISLGAGRTRLARQLLTESVLLGAFGGVLGVLLAWASLDGLRHLLAQRLPRETVVHMDLRVLAFASLLSLSTGLFFGLAPVLQVLSSNLHDRLKQGGRQAGNAPGGQRLRQGLVVSEIAFSLALLAGAGLLMRSLIRLVNVDKGFSTDHVLTMSINPSPVQYADARKEINYVGQITQNVRAMPGVQAAGLVYVLPLNGNNVNGSVKIEGHEGDSGTPPSSDKQYLNGDYFQAMRIPLLKGRFFTTADTIDSPKVVIINQEFARKFFPHQDPIGKRVDVSWGDTGWCEVIGVVGNHKANSLGTPYQPTTYMLYAQNPNILHFMSFTLVVRTSQEPISAAPAIRSAIRQLNSSQAIGNARTMDQQVAESLAPQRAPMWLFGAFSGIAVFLAAIGIYGVLSYFVLQRSQEIGVRMALGAQRGDVLQLVLGHGLRLIVIGVALGLVAAFMSVRALSSLLFGVRPTDLPTFAAVTLLLASLGILACAAPAFHATRVDPLLALRSE